jgi:hypothetical protein
MPINRRINQALLIQQANRRYSWLAWQVLLRLKGQFGLSKDEAHGAPDQPAALPQQDHRRVCAPVHEQVQPDRDPQPGQEICPVLHDHTWGEAVGLLQQDAPARSLILAWI